MKKFNFKYGSVHYNHNDLIIRLSNIINLNDHEDIEVIINDDNTLEINSKKVQSDYIHGEYDGYDLSKYDLSVNINDYTYIEEFWVFPFTRKKIRYIDGHFTLKERLPYHLITNDKWYISHNETF